MTESDPSAAAWVDRVAAASMHFVSAVGADAPASYAGFFDIDHVISDDLVGTCWIAGISDGHPRVTSTTYFDHSPVVCSLTLED
ncbi:MAG: hypothetical protein H6698_05185 [Myxococcales bacterium]|nr:hypothetical protein [Myxococcales bacterium]